MKKTVARVSALFLFLLPLFAVPSHAAEKKRDVKKETKEAVMLIPLRPSKDIPKEEIAQYEAALVKSLRTQYVVYSGEAVMQALNQAFQNRSANTPAGKECDDTKCVQDAAMAFQAGLIAKADILKIGGGYSVSLTIKDIYEDKAVYSERKSCKGCDVFGVAEILETLAGGGTVPVAEAPSSQAAKGAGSNDMELSFWNSIKDSANVADFAAYLESYPKGSFAPLAKRRMEKTPAQVAAEGEAKHPGMVFVKQGDGGFYMDKYLVTQEAYQRVIGSNPSYFEGCPTCPVETVNWDEAVAYCKKVGKVLPNEKNWEYAASEGGKNVYAGTSDESELGDYAWYMANAGLKTHPVGTKKPNGLGLYDMSGNVYEWMVDWYDSSQKTRVLRGGSWLDDALLLRAASRPGSDPGDRNR